MMGRKEKRKGSVAGKDQINYWLCASGAVGHLQKELCRIW